MNASLSQLHSYLGLPGHIDNKGWQLPDDVPAAQMREIGEKLAQVHDSASMLVGYWAVHVERQHGDLRAMTESEDWRGPGYGTCRNAMWVVRSIAAMSTGMSCQHDNLTFGHYQEIAGVKNADEWRALASWAADNRATTAQLRAELQRRRAQRHATQSEPLEGEGVVLRQGDCIERMRELDDNSIDKVLTSPPYGSDVREYDGDAHWDYIALGAEVSRVLRPGGVAATVMGITSDDREARSCLVNAWNTEFRMSHWTEIILISPGAPGSHARLRCDHQYIDIFCKGTEPRYLDPRHLTVPRRNTGPQRGRRPTRHDGIAEPVIVPAREDRLRGTVWWGYSKNPGNSPDGLLQRQHPATFPLQLASDLIRWLAPEGGVVLDPMIGSGTTAIAAIKSGRRCVGFDINGGYLETAKKRVALAEAAATIADLLPLDEAVD